MLKTAMHHSLAAQRTCRSPVCPSKTTRCASVSMILGASSGTDVCVRPQWLSSEVASNTNIKVLDATWYMPNWKKNEVEDYKQQRIPGSRFFHVDGIANRGIALPHMLPSEQAFAAAMDALGIDNNTTVVIYDQIGIFSSPRVWWTFVAMGHDASKVHILEGGFPAWKEQGLPIEQGDVADDVIMGPTNSAQQPGASSKYKAKLQASKVRPNAHCRGVHYSEPEISALSSAAVQVMAHLLAVLCSLGYVMPARVDFTFWPAAHGTSATATAAAQCACMASATTAAAAASLPS
jgi:rhodanese-related sulfurtransferase